MSQSLPVYGCVKWQSFLMRNLDHSVSCMLQYSTLGIVIHDKVVSYREWLCPGTSLRPGQRDS